MQISLPTYPFVTISLTRFVLSSLLIVSSSSFIFSLSLFRLYEQFVLVVRVPVIPIYSWVYYKHMM